MPGFLISCPAIAKTQQEIIPLNESICKVRVVCFGVKSGM